MFVIFKYIYMFDVNICSPYWDVMPNTNTNVYIIRLLMITNLFILYIMYVVIGFIKKKSINSLKLEDQIVNSNAIRQSERQFNLWEKEYLILLGDHGVSLGFVISFSPYAFQAIASIIFVILRLGYQLRKHKWQTETKSIKTILRIINMILLVAAMIGVSRTDKIGQKLCMDKNYNPI